jgi:hypothetical protein
MILYIIGLFILCIVLFFLYIRIRYQFWALQPVFHFYDLYYWFVNVGIIRHELPEKNRYTNFKNITTKTFEDMNELTLKEAILLIKLNYLRNKENIYSPKKENIVPYFIGHNSKTYWSYYLEQEILIDNKTGKTIDEKKIIGIITSRPLHVKILKNEVRGGEFDVFYVDNLCVEKNWRKKNIAAQLIQTHEYNQCHQNKKISVSLFKREEELTGIIPLTVYKTYCFNMRNWVAPQVILEAKIKLLTADNQNMYYFYNFLIELSNNKRMKKLDIIIYPEMSNVIELIRTKNLYIKMLVVNGEIEAVYIFRKTCINIEKDKEIISCIGSIYKENSVLTRNEFIIGFKMGLWSIIKENKNFGYLVVEDISDNRYIINNLCLKTHPFIVSPMAYFFYNFAYSPFKSERCFILN